MKIINKMIKLLTFACVLLVLNPVTAEAATGRIMFTDLTTAAGEEFEITIKVVSYDDDIDEMSVELSYDNEKIRFLDGDSTSGGNGTLNLEAQATSDENSYILRFKALKNGTTNISINNQVIATDDGVTFEMQEGSSKVSVVGGTEVDEMEEEQFEEEVLDMGNDYIIELEGVTYQISNNFVDGEIPDGYTRDELVINNKIVQMVRSDISNIALVYLVSDEIEVDEEVVGYEPKGRFFRFEESTGVFYPYVQITVSDDVYIIFLAEEYPNELPEKFIATTMTADGYAFPAWQDTELEGYYLIYALSSQGDKLMYRYEVNDQSYQRYAVIPDAPNPYLVKSPTLQIVVDVIAANLLEVLSMIAMVFILLFVLMIVFGVKLINRNKEIDDIYLEDSTAYNYETKNKSADKAKNKKSKSKNNSRKKAEVDEFDGVGASKSIEADMGMEMQELPELNLEEFLSTPPIYETNTPQMLDDGLTQEFDITMDDDIFNQDGFIDFKDDRFEKSQVNLGELMEKSKIEAKYHIDDDDDVEFIEL